MRRPLLVLVVAWCALVAVAAFAQNPRTTIGVDEIRPGMTGYGLTVFRGTAPERFDVEVIDVLHNFRPDQDLILVRTDHRILRTAVTVGGMSGSPIYLDGRLAGAYAYGWPFGLEPVAGVTPIANMLDDMRMPVRPDAFPGARPLGPRRPGKRRAPRAALAGPSPRLAGLPPYTGGRVDALEALRRHGDRIGSGTSRDGLAPASTPLMLGGFHDSIADLLGEALSGYGLTPLQAGGGRAAPSGAALPDFVDGGAIGVQLVRGDVAATAIGTVTHVGDGRLVAFGHPMMSAGQTGLPTCAARVLHILASRSRSFKIAEAAEARGTLINDRQASIVVDPNLQAATIPVRVKLRGIPGVARDEWNMEVASHRVLSPVLTFAAIANAVKAASSDQTDVVFTARTTVRVVDRDPIELVDRGIMRRGPGDTSVLSRLRMFEVFAAAYGNPFEESRVTGVDFEIDVTFGRDYVEIVDAAVATTEVDPGSTVNVRVVTRRYGQDDQVRLVPVHVPMTAAGQTLDVSVEPGDEVEIEQARPRSLDDLLAAVEDAHPATSLVVSLKMPSRGLRFRGQVVRDLPPSALDALQLTSEGGLIRPFVTYDRQVVDVGEVLSGDARLRLQVRETPRRR